MTTVCCQYPLDNGQKALLCSEFPRCRFVFSHYFQEDKDLGDILSDAEIFFGDTLSTQIVANAPHLRWVQAPGTDLRRLPLELMRDRGDIMITAVEPENAFQTGEFVIGAVLALAKGFCHWANVQGEPERLWSSTEPGRIWTLENRIFLQVGLGTIGTEICRRAQQLDMRVRGVHHTHTYHPYCEKVLRDADLNSILPVCDVVSVSLSYAWRYRHSFGKEQLSLMKDDSILIVTGSGAVVDEKELAQVGASGKFRGVVLDAVESPPLSKTSPLWQVPNMWVTPSVAAQPKKTANAAFRSFRANLRNFLPGNYNNMRGNVNLALWTSR